MRWVGYNANDVLAGRLVIKQRACAKYLHKSVLPCAAREELILLLHGRDHAYTNSRVSEHRKTSPQETM